MSTSANLELVRKAILAGTLGNIQWKDSAARLLLRNPDLASLTPQGIRALPRQHVAEGNNLDVRVEKRDEYKVDHPFWYRAVFDVPGLFRGLFVEVILVDDDPDEPFVEIVSVHL